MNEDIYAGNRLLGSVEPELRRQIAMQLQLAELRAGDILYSLGDQVDHVYFPLQGLVGILAETPDGEAIDSALIGREGAIGVFEACGSRQFLAEARVHVPGQAVRISATLYRELFECSPALRDAVHRYVEQLMSEIRQSVVCNSIHDVEARLCRTVLEALDRSGLEDVLPLTQLMMAGMLGSQRSTVAQIVARLVAEGAVATRRGALVINDRAALERLCCGCRISVRVARASIWAAGEQACEAVLAAE
jgi:CRP-like cAMP-binding protein